MFNFLQILTAILIAVARWHSPMPLSFLGKCGYKGVLPCSPSIIQASPSVAVLVSSVAIALILLFFYLWECRILADAGGITRARRDKPCTGWLTPSESVLA